MSSLVNNGQAYYKPGNLVQTGVLGQSGTLQATAGDVTLATGVMTFSNGVSVTIDDITGYLITPYTLGQPQISALNLTSITVEDNTLYKLVFLTKNDNQVYTSTIISNVGSTAATIAAQFAQQISNNASFPVSAVAIGNYIVLTEASITTGGFLVTAPSGAVLSNTVTISGTVSGPFTVGETVTQTTSTATGIFVSQTASSVTLIPVTGTFVGTSADTLTGGTSAATVTTLTGIVTNANVQSSGGQYEVTVLTSINPPLNAGNYRLYAIQYNQPVINSQVGGQTVNSALAWVWINELATNFAALDTQIKAILAGTATTAHYLGAK